MGMLDKMTGSFGEQLKSGNGKEGSILSSAMDLFSGAGGLHGLINSFQQKGLGDIVSSWVSRGENRSITPQQVKEGIGSDRVSQVAAKAGVSEDEAAQTLSRHLPDFIDKMTPEGNVPEGGWMEKGKELLKARFFS